MKIANGNKKIGKDTFIVNFTSATDCPSKARGLCKHPDKCYAMKPELRYNNWNDPRCTLKARRKNCKDFNSMTAQDFADFVIKKAKNKRNEKIKYLRFSECGDFRNQADVDKIIEIAKLLEPYNIKVYGYTARRDLDFSKCNDNITINGSGFMIHNNFEAVKEPKGVTCKGDCKACDLCKVTKNQTVQVKYH